jgi:hypothetical protein
MKANRIGHAAAAGLMTLCMGGATASAQNFMSYLYGASAGAIENASITNLAPNWVATAMCNGGGDLELITWESNGSALLRKGSAIAGPIANANVGTVALTPNLVVTGSINSGSLEFQTWNVSATGAVTAGSSVGGGAAWAFSMVKLNSKAFLVAALDNAEEVTIYLYTYANGGVGWAGQIGGPKGKIVGVTAIGSSQLVTAIRTLAGTLQIDSWGLNADNDFRHEGTNTAGTIVGLGITAHTGGVATAVANSANDLEVIDWTVNPTTGAIARKSSFTVSRPGDSVWVSTIGSQIFTASRSQSGNMAAGVWGYNGTQLEAGDFAQHESIIVGLGAAPLSTGLYSVTLGINLNGDLQLDVWSGDYVAP